MSLFVLLWYLGRSCQILTSTNCPKEIFFVMKQNSIGRYFKLLVKTKYKEIYFCLKLFFNTIPSLKHKFGHGKLLNYYFSNILFIQMHLSFLFAIFWIKSIKCQTFHICYLTVNWVKIIKLVLNQIDGSADVVISLWYSVTEIWPRLTCNRTLIQTSFSTLKDIYMD